MRKISLFCPANILTFIKWSQSYCSAPKDLTILISECTNLISLSPPSLPAGQLRGATSLLETHVIEQNTGTGGPGQTNNSPFCMWQLALRRADLWLRYSVWLGSHPQNSKSNVNNSEHEKKEARGERVRLESIAWVSRSLQEIWPQAMFQIWGSFRCIQLINRASWVRPLLVPHGKQNKFKPDHRGTDARHKQPRHPLKKEKLLYVNCPAEQQGWTRPFPITALQSEVTVFFVLLLHYSLTNVDPLWRMMRIQHKREIHHLNIN